MKSTASLDVAGQPVDLPSATGETAIPGDNSTPENKRRRLLRGAVALAPLVLTLRSGALAAASCTGAKTVTVALGTDQKIPGSVAVVAGGPNPDVCYKTSDVPACSIPGKVLNRAGPQTAYPVQANRTCGASPLPAGTNVAILSATSATSLVS